MANPASLNITELAANAGTNTPAAQAVDTNGTINCAVQSRMGRLMIEIVNAAAAALTVTIKAGTGVQAHTARDLVIALAATGGASAKQVIGPLEATRFVKADGSIDINFLAAAGAPNATILVYRLPKQ